MDILLKHWLSIGSGIFLLSMVLYGHYRGFLRLAVTFSALILSVVTVHFAMPRVTGYLQENTEIHKTIGNGLLKFTGIEYPDEHISNNTPSYQREIIEQLKIPQQMKEALLENNNREIYQILKVEEFFDYLGTYLAGMVINLVGSVLLFLFVYIGLRFIIYWLDLLARLPILHGINQISGAVLGGVKGLLILWLFLLIVQIFDEQPWTGEILTQIHGSLWLNILYNNNVFNWGFIKILSSFL